MDELVDLWETPVDRENVMIVGWNQWADAGECSSGLPRYLIDRLDARKIGIIKPDTFYLFQIPGTHHLLRPEVTLNEGYRENMSVHRNEVYYAEMEDKGLLIFLGDEPHQNEQRYADAFFDMVEALNVRRVVAVAGVYGAMPYDRDRDISCVYSLPKLKPELENYAVNFSDYQGGATIGTFLAHWAEFREVELVVLYAFAPAYEFSQLGITLQSMRVEEDWKAWLDLLRRIDYMMALGLDLSDLEERSRDLVDAWDAKVDELEQEHPELHVRSYLQDLVKDFEERPFIPLDDAWNELDDLLQGMDRDEEE
jgi:proteasome assembly chaperone (PAC2) family protein